MNNHDGTASAAQAMVAARPAARASSGMKKFSSKLFSPFRLGRPRASESNGVSDWDVASTRESSPDVHQLTSKRRRGRGGQVKLQARNGRSRIVADDQNPPCEACAAINFPRLLNWTPGQPRPWIPLAHTLAGDSECPYCIFFQALVGTLPDETRKFTPYLRIRQAFERLGVGEKHELGSAVLFEVTTKSKAYPWGYIVKAVEDDDDLAGYRSTTPLLRGRVVSPKLDPTVPRTWIDFCMTNHKFTACGSTRPMIRGLKLLDCREEEIVFVDDLNAQAVEYATLSYAGGTVEEDSDHSHIGLPKPLPQLIADAMTVTKSLGFRYLWVDRFCFPQFSTAERRRQFGLMGDIFSRSALTIIVAAGEGIQDGIPGVSVPREQQLSLQTDTGFFTTSLTRPDAEVAGSKWASRGWTYQEGLLARRRLIFTPSQVYFQCQSLHCHESISYPLQTKPTLNLGRVFPTNGVGLHAGDFKTQMNAFIGLEFTNFEDRLDAFRGVLDRYAQMDPPMENLLGLPLFHVKDFKNGAKATRTDRLAIALGWKADEVSDSPDYVHPLYLDNAFPSWTWLAWKLRPEYSGFGPSFQFYEVGDTSPVIENATAAPGLEAFVGFKDDVVLSWETDAELIIATANPLSFLRLKAYCFDIRLRRELDGTTDVISPDFKDSYRPILTSFLLRSGSDNLEAGPPKGNHDFVGVIISGRDIKKNGEAFESLNVLICGRRNWETGGGELVRLGTLELKGDGGIEGGSMHGVLNDEKRLSLSLRTVDLH